MRLSKDRPGSDIDDTSRYLSHVIWQSCTRIHDVIMKNLSGCQNPMNFRGSETKNVTFTRKDVRTVGVDFIAYFLRQRMFCL